MPTIRAATLAVFIVLLPALSLAQAPVSSEAAALQALVSEIRELRLSLERSNLLNLRFQTALQANQLHAERLKELSQQMNIVTNELSQMNRQQSALIEAMKSIEKDLGNPSDETRARAELELPKLKVELEGIGQRANELRGRESQLASEIQRETVQMEDWRRWLQQFNQPLQPGR